MLGLICLFLFLIDDRLRQFLFEQSSHHYSYSYAIYHNRERERERENGKKLKKDKVVG